LVYGFERHFQQYISYILTVSFIGVELFMFQKYYNVGDNQ